VVARAAAATELPVMRRTNEEVLRDHLELARRGDWETDLARNYTEDVVIIASSGVFRGREGARQEAARLLRDLPVTDYRYTCVRVVGDVGYLTWTAKGGGLEVRDGTDTYVFAEDGRIRAQTFHYTVLDEQGRVVAGE